MAGTNYFQNNLFQFKNIEPTKNQSKSDQTCSTNLVAETSANTLNWDTGDTGLEDRKKGDEFVGFLWFGPVWTPRTSLVALAGLATNVVRPPPSPLACQERAGVHRASCGHATAVR